ncbi:MAG: hypothetical protein OXJ37_16520 [Bryobacterales bacterium]|nr:hypothetical protein [Bryobacterales bacterium]MDE0264009.1 hypothetical protein [Bryobacterales bacterium]MDE0622110.1 hypothetical protein [Bryobacterales bacterium]
MTIRRVRAVMLPGFLFSETTVQESGSGEPVEIASGGGTALLSLGITEIVEQESLDVCVRGSVDGEEWIEEPLRSFPQKFYTGVWQLLFDLGASPEVRFLRVDYKVARWGVGSQVAKFKFYVFAEPFGG